MNCGIVRSPPIVWVGAISVFMVLSFSGVVEEVFAQAPIANAGPDQIVASGATVTLDGSGSTVSGTPFYAWTKPTDYTINLSDSLAVQTTFVAPTGPATLTFRLLVGDISTSPVQQSSDTVTITVLAPPLPPVADAGPPQTVRYGDTVTLDGSGSTDPNGDQITYSWARTSGLTASLTDDDTAQPTFTAPSSTGTITFTLTVTAGTDTDTDDVIITVTAPTQNQPPTANAGRDRMVTPGSTVTLSGSGTDPDGDTLEYTWEQTSGTPTVNIDDLKSARTTFTAPADPTELVFTLTVDDRTDTTTDDITITIAKPITRNIKEMGDTLVSAKITAPNEITMTYNEELSTFINSYLNFTITGESIPRSITGIDGSPSIKTGKTIFVDGERIKTYSTTLIFDGEPVSSGSTGSMYIQHADHYLAFIHVSDGQN